MPASCGTIAFCVSPAFRVSPDRSSSAAEAQSQLARALRSAVAECQEADLPWTEVGERIGLPRETVFRQWASDGPIVTVRASPARNTVVSDNDRPSAADAVFVFQSGQPGGQAVCRTLLRVRVGHCDQNVSFNSVQAQLADGTERRVTHEVTNLLYEDGETPLRRALTQFVRATLSNPEVAETFAHTVHRAATAQARRVPAGGEVAGDPVVLGVVGQAHGERATTWSPTAAGVRAAVPFLEPSHPAVRALAGHAQLAGDRGHRSAGGDPLDRTRRALACPIEASGLW